MYSRNSGQHVVCGGGDEESDGDGDGSNGETELMTAATTLTLEPDISLSGINNSASPGVDRPPRLVCASRRMREEGVDDVKELTVQGYIGQTTTISLKFGNRKSKMQRMTTRAIQMRFDSLYSNDDPNNANTTTTTATNNQPRDESRHHKSSSTKKGKAPKEFEIENAFRCTPRNLDIAPNSEVILYVSFTPDRFGVYSGALKIKSKKKVRYRIHLFICFCYCCYILLHCAQSFVILLRGEALGAVADNPPPCPEYSNVHPPLQQPKESRETKKLERLPPPPNIGGHVSLMDPLVMRQKWLRGWLGRSTRRGSSFHLLSFSLLDIRIYMVSFPFRFKLSIGRVEQENVFSREVKYQCHASHDCADVSYQY